MQEKAHYPDDFYKQTILFFDNGDGTMTQHDLMIPPGGGQRLGASFDFNDRQEIMVVGHCRRNAKGHQLASEQHVLRQVRCT